MFVRLMRLQDEIRSSLFFVPMLFVVGAAVFGEVMLQIDDNVGAVPSRLTATVDSSRSVLSTVAGATLAFAGVAFSVSLLLISLASSQYSPRVVHGLFRDPFNKRVMGIVIGTFTYCLVVMRAVRGPLEESGQAVVPSLAVLVAVVLGVVSILSIVAFINHSAHTMDVSKILHSVTTESINRVRQTWRDEGPEIEPGLDEDGVPDGAGFAVVFDAHGWVQQIDIGALIDLLPPGARLRIDTLPGRYAIPKTPLCTIWPAPADGDERHLVHRARAAVIIGQTRTMQQDAAYGVRQLVDVALKALSPGINDPTTAQDALFHLGAVVHEMLVREPPAHRVSGSEDRAVLVPQQISHEELVDLAFDEVRLAAATQPTVQIYVLEILHLLAVSLNHDRACRAALTRQARLVVETCTNTDLLADDIERVRAAYRSRFG